MKKFTKLHQIAALACLFGANASAAVYVSDFTGLADDQNLNGFDSWAVSPTVGDDSGDPVAYGANVGGVRGFQVGGALDAPTAGPGPTITASRSLTGISLVSAGPQPTVLMTNFALVDSLGFSERNDYSISLWDGGTELFTISFAAVASDPSGMDDSWSVGFGSSALGPVSGANFGIAEYDDGGTPLDDSDDDGLHTLSVTFIGSGADVNFYATITGAGSNTWTGKLNGLSAANVTEIRVGSNLGAETSWGDGVMGISGLNVIPEPSSALLVGVAALGLLRRRRVQA